MRGFLRRAVGRTRDLAARQPFAVLLAVGLIGAGGVSVGGFYAAQSYEQVQADNDFCLSCHTMTEPYEEFARSAHRDLGCKACHDPTLVERGRMVLTEAVGDTLWRSQHAVVPNEACASCHIDGNPEDWALISQSAGHRVHLESDEASLEGLQCVECHASGVHEFASTDQTCAQSGCHDDIEVTLGRMGDFTIHCAACHGFSRAVPVAGDIVAAREGVAPTGTECLSCHVMRTLVDMPDDEPHEQVCSTCHNPHTQVTPADAVETCASVGCHDDPRALTPFHRGIEAAVLTDCSTCHVAHDWAHEGGDCLSCHQDIFEDGGVGASASAAATSSAPMATSFASLQSPGRYLHVSRAVAQEPQEPARRQRTPNRIGDVDFRHANHRDVECTSCHVSTESHGAITVTQISDCRSCHHVGETAESCESCHRGPQLAGRGPFTVDQLLAYSVLDQPVARGLPFGHGEHADVTCATCHLEGLTRPSDAASCLTCHEDHHAVGATCMSCHEQPVESAHTVESHLGCGGAGCHNNPAYDALPRDRQGCLSCHQDLVEHRPGEECAACHALPGQAAP